MWGQVATPDANTIRSRIIPTRVGTSDITSCPDVITGDHPHACGDKVAVFLRIVYKQGSSPRVWGQEEVKMLIETEIGIIPTRVGLSLIHISEPTRH